MAGIYQWREWNFTVNSTSNIDAKFVRLLFLFLCYVHTLGGIH
jgi:hypothetical protein